MTVNYETVIREYAEKIGKRPEELTQAEKATAMYLYLLNRKEE